MTNPIGHVCEIVRYPIKSMAGTTIESAALGWHGLAGDRRLAFRRVGDESGFPWLTAGRVPELLLYQPIGAEESTASAADEPLPTHVRTPEGRRLELFSAELCREIAGHFGSGVELMRLKHGIFDEAPVSVMSLATVAGIGRTAGMELDRRRFRANIIVDTGDCPPFAEDQWVGGTLVFGDGGLAPAVSVTMRDVRCGMVNLDPNTAAQDERVLKAIVGLNGNNAGVYAAVVRTGPIRVGDPVSLVPAVRD